jgi:hypothetical protein
MMSAVPEAACSRRGGVTEGDEVGPGHHGATLGDDVWPAWTPRPRARVRQREMLCSSCIAVLESPRWLPSSWRCRLAAVPCLLVAVMVPMGSWAKAMLLSKTVRNLPPPRPGHTNCTQGYSSSCTSTYVRQPVSFMLDLSIESVTILERQLMNVLPLPYFSLANVVATSCMHACSIYIFKHTVPAAIVSQLLFQKLQRHVCMVELITEKGSFEPMER